MRNLFRCGGHRLAKISAMPGRSSCRCHATCVKTCSRGFHGRLQRPRLRGNAGAPGTVGGYLASWATPLRGRMRYRHSHTLEPDINWPANLRSGPNRPPRLAERLFLPIQPRRREARGAWAACSERDRRSAGSHRQRPIVGPSRSAG